ncbi:MAG TPA: hypothetical protein VMT00_00475 [Thermoanaerobaculia bacterium]|nr:hypothetical protein [Thermoanaerobaculia bacterium]
MRAVIGLIAATVAFSAVATAAPEPWWEAYNRGVTSVRAGNHAAASQALQQAISENPTESAAARVKTDTIIYVPHFWLGIAKFNLGDVDGALRELNTSLSQGAIRNTMYFSDLRDWIARAQAQQQRLAENIAAEGRRDANAAIKRAVSAHMDVVAAGADRGDAYRTGQRRLQEAMAVTNQAGTNLAEYKRATEMAVQARELFASAIEEAKKQKTARPAAQKAPPVAVIREAPVTVEAPPAAPASDQGSARPPPITSSEPAVPKGTRTASATVSPSQADARVALQQYRRRLSAATREHQRDRDFATWSNRAASESEQWQRDLGGATDENASRIRSLVKQRERELSEKLETIARTRAAVIVTATNERALLEAAYRAFAGGDFAQAEDVLTRAIESSPWAEAYLLRGCSRYTRAVLSRNSDDLLASAASDLKMALQLNRSLRLDPKAFSPKLLAYFEQIRRE